MITIKDIKEKEIDIDDIVEFLNNSSKEDVVEAIKILKDQDLLKEIEDLDILIYACNHISFDEQDMYLYLDEEFPILPDERLLKMAKMYSDSRFRALTYTKMRLDGNKVNVLKEFKDLSNVQVILNSIKNDEIIKYLMNHENYFENIDGCSKSEIKLALIKAINDDNLKVEYLKELNNSNDIEFFGKDKILEIIKTINSDEIKEEYINNPEYEEYKWDIISNLKNVDLIKKYFIKWPDFYAILAVLKLLSLNTGCYVLYGMDTRTDTDKLIEIFRFVKSMFYVTNENGEKILSANFVSQLDEDDSKALQIKDITNYLICNDDYTNYELISKLGIVELLKFIKNDELRDECLVKMDVEGTYKQKALNRINSRKSK